VTHNGSMDARLARLSADLERIFRARLTSLVAYGDLGPESDDVHTLALVEGLTFQDLTACAPLAYGWKRSGLEVPLMLSRDEFLRTLDVFPLEFGAIIAHHVVVRGDNPFAGMQVNETDLRRACELQAKSHLIHLREGYVESGAQPPVVARLIAASAPALRSLVEHLERLESGAAERAGVTPDLIREVANAGASSIADPSALFARYLAAVERLWEQVDRWRAR
jgi:hypothetical protein